MFFSGPTTVKVRVTGLTPGLHGFHLVSLIYFLFPSLFLFWLHDLNLQHHDCDNKHLPTVRQTPVNI